MSWTDPRIDELSSLEVFDGCTTRQLERIATLADHVHFAAGAPMTNEGKTGRECFVLVDGEADVTIRGEHLATVGPGAIIGEMAIIEHEPRAATVTATTDVEALVFTPQGFNAMLDVAPRVVKQVLSTLSQRLREVQAA